MPLRSRMLFYTAQLQWRNRRVGPRVMPPSAPAGSPALASDFTHFKFSIISLLFTSLQRRLIGHFCRGQVEMRFFAHMFRYRPARQPSNAPFPRCRVRPSWRLVAASRAYRWPYTPRDTAPSPRALATQQETRHAIIERDRGAMISLPIASMSHRG